MIEAYYILNRLPLKNSNERMIKMKYRVYIAWFIAYLLKYAKNTTLIFIHILEANNSRKILDILF